MSRWRPAVKGSWPRSCMPGARVSRPVVFGRCTPQHRSLRCPPWHACLRRVFRRKVSEGHHVVTAGSATCNACKSASADRSPTRLGARAARTPQRDSQRPERLPLGRTPISDILRVREQAKAGECDGSNPPRGSGVEMEASGDRIAVKVLHDSLVKVRSAPGRPSALLK